MKFASALFRLLFAVGMLAFVGAAVGAAAGLMLVGMDTLNFDHVQWLAAAGALLFVRWGFTAVDGSATEPLKAPKSKPCAVELSGDDFIAEMHASCGIWRQ